MSMIERVARAISQHVGPFAFDDLPRDRPEMKNRQRAGEDVFDTQAEMLETARAAIEAMREPSEAMFEAGGEAPLNMDRDVGRGPAGRVWSGMIDAALSEHSA